MIATALLVAAKDLRIELRSRVLAWQVVPFGVLALLLCGLALGPRQAGHSSAGPGLYYLVILLVTLLMINRSQAVERTAGTRASIATLGLDPAGVFLGKALALAVELWVTGLVLLAGSVLVLHTALHGAILALPSVLVALAAPVFLGFQFQRAGAQPWHRIEVQGLTLEVQGDTSTNFACHPEVLCDSVLANLVSNAIKFSPRGAKIELTCGVAGTQVWIRVADRGPGIPGALLDEFRKGHRLPSGKGSEGEKGTGLGLLLAHDYARFMGGELELGPREGGGTEATLRLRKYNPLPAEN